MTSAASDIPSRLDRLPWSGWHWRVVMALGIAWVLDGLEVTLVGSVGSVLEREDTLALSAAQVGWTGSVYIGGAVLGALIFGRLADCLYPGAVLDRGVLHCICRRQFCLPDSKRSVSD